MVRELEVKPGDKLIAHLANGALILQPKPNNILEYLDSFPKGVYGRTREEIDAYIAESRGTPHYFTGTDADGS